MATRYGKSRLLFFLIALQAFAQPVRAGSQDQHWNYVRVVAVDQDELSLDVEVAPFAHCFGKMGPNSNAGQCRQLHILVDDSVVKSRLKAIRPGDRINIVVSTGDGNRIELKDFCLSNAPEPELHTRVFVLTISFAIWLFVASVCSRFRPQRFLLGEDNRYSNSKVQIALWFLVLISTYTGTFIFRAWYLGCEFLGGINIPSNLLLLSGISALTYAGAKGITTSKVETATGNDPKPPAPSPSLWNLVQNDHKVFDFGDFQMLVVTFIAIATYLLLVIAFLTTITASTTVSLPDLDTTILATFGLGQGSYLAKKAVGPVGES
jgi:hypothetical protein